LSCLEWLADPDQPEKLGSPYDEKMRELRERREVGEDAPPHRAAKPARARSASETPPAARSARGERYRAGSFERHFCWPPQSRRNVRQVWWLVV
jgi:hypothetical protein